jgi:triosephosphate isomerase
MSDVRPLVAGNWKMNGLKAAASELARMIQGAADLAGKADLMICPPATQLMNFVALARNSAIQIGAQDCHAEKSGGFYRRRLGRDDRRYGSGCGDRRTFRAQDLAP